MGFVKISSVVLFCFITVTVTAHVRREGGLFYKYLKYSGDTGVQKSKPQYEDKVGGSGDSDVLLVHDIQSFNKLVVNQSAIIPVVVKFFSPRSIDSIRVKKNFQEVASQFKKNIMFVAVDILENRDIFAQLTTIYRLNRFDLPLFIFFKDGQLCMPPSEPTPMLQGYFTKENLVNFIKKKFLL